MIVSAKRQGVPAALMPILLLVLGLIPICAPTAGYGYLVPIASQVLIYAIAASGINLLVGYGGVFSLGHAAFVAVGAYIVAIAAQYASTSGVDGLLNQALVMWPIAIGLTTLLSILIGMICLKREGLTLAMITLALGQMVYLVLVALKPFGGDDGLNMYPRNVLGTLSIEGDITFFYVSYGCLLIYLGFLHFVLRSRYGRVIEATAINPTLTATLGFSLYWSRLICFAIAAAGCALTGILIANANEFVSPKLGNWSVMGDLLVMVVLGGIRSRAGPLIGALFYIVLQRVLSDYVESPGLIIGAFVICIVLLFPRGLLQIFETRTAR